MDEFRKHLGNSCQHRQDVRNPAHVIPLLFDILIQQNLLSFIHMHMHKYICYAHKPLLHCMKVPPNDVTQAISTDCVVCVCCVFGAHDNRYIGVSFLITKWSASICGCFHYELTLHCTLVIL